MLHEGQRGAEDVGLDESLAPDDNTEAIEEMIVDPNVEVVEGYPPNVMTLARRSPRQKFTNLPDS